MIAFVAVVATGAVALSLTGRVGRLPRAHAYVPAAVPESGPQIGTISFDGVKGGEGFREQLPIHSLRWRARLPFSPGGGTTGRSTLGPLIVEKRIDAATPILAFELARGRFESRTAVVRLFRPGTTDVYFTYQLTDPVVTGIRHIDQDRELLTLMYRQIRWTYTTASDNQISRCWDVSEDVAC